MAGEHEGEYDVEWWPKGLAVHGENGTPDAAMLAYRTVRNARIALDPFQYGEGLPGVYLTITSERAAITLILDSAELAALGALFEMARAQLVGKGAQPV